MAKNDQAPLVAVSLVFLFACAPASAWCTFGSIVGMVQDESGAIIPGSLVELTNMDENTARKTVSNDVGLFPLWLERDGWATRGLGAALGFAPSQLLEVSPKTSGCTKTRSYDLKRSLQI